MELNVVLFPGLKSALPAAGDSVDPLPPAPITTAYGPGEIGAPVAATTPPPPAPEPLSLPAPHLHLPSNNQ